MTKVTGLGVGKSDEWATPPQIFRALYTRFDLDVAAPESGPLHTPCDRWYHEKSLEKEWSGFVWMNPPFGGRNALAPWLDRFFSHGHGIALTPDRTSSPWFHAAFERCSALLFVRGRTPFLLPNGQKAGNPAFGTALWAAGDAAAKILHTAATTRGLGIFVQGPTP